MTEAFNCSAPKDDHLEIPSQVIYKIKLGKNKSMPFNSVDTHTHTHTNPKFTTQRGFPPCLSVIWWNRFSPISISPAVHTAYSNSTKNQWTHTVFLGFESLALYLTSSDYASKMRVTYHSMLCLSASCVTVMEHACWCSANMQLTLCILLCMPQVTFAR